MKHKIRAMLDKHGQNQNDLAELLNISYQALSMKINQKNDFTQTEIFKIIQCYNLTPEEVMDMFFNISDRYEQS